MNKYESPEYRRSRGAYNAQCAFEYFVSLLVTDAFLAKLLTHIGISDAVCGIISSLVSFAFLVQLIAIPLMRHLKTVKTSVIVFDSLSVLFFLSAYLIPFAGAEGSLRTVLVFVSIMGGYFCKYLVFSIYFRWANSYVEPSKRGVFSAVKEMISLIGGIVFTLAVGFIVDRFEADGNLEGGFIFIAVIIFVLSILNFITLYLIRRDEPADEQTRRPVREVLNLTFGNRNFVNVVIMSSLWYAAVYFTTGFLGTFKTSDLMMSVGTVQVINTAGCLARFFVSRPFGRYSDKTSYARGYSLALIIAAAAFAANIFAAPSTKWLVVVYTILYNVSLAGSSQNSYNILYSYVPEDCFVQAMSIKNSISGIVGFLASVAGGKLLEMIQANGNTLFGIHVYGQQVLSLISLVITIITVIFAVVVVGRQKVMKQ